MVETVTPSDRSDWEKIRQLAHAVLLALSRRWKAAALTCVAALLGMTLTLSMLPRRYSSEMKLLVKRERLDPLLSPQNASAQQVRMDVTETELNSEAELLRSRDLLEGVVIASDLVTREASTPTGGSAPSPDAVARAVKLLERDLSIAIVKRTTLIEAQYTSSDPQLAARVLANLARLYLDKHLTVNRPSGAYEFFTTQVDDFRTKLQSAEERLRDFGRREHIVSATAEGATTLQRLADFEAALQQADGGIVETTRRLDEIQHQMAALPPRVTTSIRTSQNAQYVRDLRASVLALEVRLADLSGRFAPTYPPVVALQKQLDQTRSALAAAEHEPITDETTDRDPTYQWLESEAAHVRVEHEAVVARAASLKRTIAAYRSRAATLDAKDVVQQRLAREVKSAEDNYLLYQRKQEETRIANALDHQRIANVVVAEAPNVPSLPSDDQRRGMVIVLGATLSFLLGVGAAIALEFVPARVRTAQELRSVLNLRLSSPYRPAPNSPDHPNHSRGLLSPMGRAARTLIESERLSSWRTIGGEAIAGLREHPLDLEPLAIGAGPGGSGDGPVALPRSAVDLAIEWDHERRLSAFEQGRVQIHTAHDGEGQLSQALSDLMRQVCLGRSQDLLPRSLVFVPTRRCADAHLPAAIAAEALAAQVSEPVCLVDADLRAPSLHQRFGIRRAPGVSDLLVHRLMPIPVPLRGNWSLMPAGTRCLEAVRLFATERGRRQLHRLIRRFAYTVISAPPPVTSSDASLLGSLADGVVLVVNEPSMRTRRLAAVAGQLKSAGVRIVGAVLHAPGSGFLDALDRWF